MKKLFLSHAVKDKELVDAFIELLEGGVGIEKEAIFCTSSEGQGIPTGEDFNPFMRTELQHANIVVALVTENYYESAFCLCETGGAWYGEKPFVPLLSPPVNFGDLRGALYGKQAGLLNETRSLNEAYDRLRKFLDARDHGVARWNARRDKFIARLPEMLEKIGRPEGLKAAEADALRKELALAKQAVSDLDTELEAAEKKIAALRKAKSSEEVKRIDREFAGEETEFHELVGTASGELHKLTKVVREAAFAHYLDQPIPGEYVGDRSTDEAIEEKYLSDHGSDGIFLNENHPKVKRALRSLGELRDFMSRVESDVDSSFSGDYEEENDDLFDFTNRSFWRNHNLL
jgi:hypothetical protein